MAATILVVSDLHLVDGNPLFEQWGTAQQRAFAAMLEATRPRGALADASVELVINGDCFDFLLAPPHLGSRPRTDVTLAHAKWTSIVTAHEAWFQVLRRFLEVPGRRLTFTIGNHDLELIYPSIRSRIRSAIHAPPGTVRFCLGRNYAPLPDVVIEHGCQFDAWNVLPGIWEKAAPPIQPAQLEFTDTRGQAIGPALLPWGSRYYTHVFLPFKERFPYLDRMWPDLSFTRQMALICVLAPDLVRTSALHTADLLVDPSPVEQAFAGVANDAAALFTAAMLATGAVVNTVAGGAGVAGMDTTALAEITDMAQAVTLERGDALRHILTNVQRHPRTLEEVTAIQAILGRGEDAPHLFVMGHTHAEGRWPLPKNGALLNTGTWVTRFATPHPEEWFADLDAWFTDQRQSGRAPADGSRFICAWLRGEHSTATVGELIAWDGHDFQPVADDVATAL